MDGYRAAARRSYREPPSFDRPSLVGPRPPRCPPYVEITQFDQLLPLWPMFMRMIGADPKYCEGVGAEW